MQPVPQLQRAWQMALPIIGTDDISMPGLTLGHDTF